MVTRVAIETSVRRQEMSYESYLALDHENRIIEWVDEEIIIHMPPAFSHQTVVSFLNQLLSAFISYFQLGQLIIAPFEAKLWPDGPSREPDLLFIRKDHLNQLAEKRFEGAPDLVVEIVSPGSATIDRVNKFNEYEQAGVQEYWIIDPRPFQKQADFYVRGEDGRFHDALLDENGRYASYILPNFWLDAAWFLADELPDPQFALAQIMLTIDDLPADARSTFQAMHDLFAPKS